MSNGIGRLFKLQAKINMMVVDGTRDAEEVADALQVVLERKILAGILEEGGLINLSAVDRFVVSEKFKVDVNGELPISYLGDNLWENFLDLVEENVPAMTVRKRKLLKSSPDKRILAALGDNNLDKIEKARTYLAHVFEFLKTADRNKWYVFYVADKNGNVWAVFAAWNVGGWDVGAFSVQDPIGWCGGDLVVSR